MGTRRLLDASGGIITEFYHDDSEDLSIIRRVQDCEPVVEANKRMQNEEPLSPYRNDEWGRPYARVPIIWMEKWMQEFRNQGGVPWDRDGWRKFLLKKLDDSDFRAFRVDKRSLWIGYTSALKVRI